MDPLYKLFAYDKYILLLLLQIGLLYNSLLITKLHLKYEMHILMWHKLIIRL